MVEGLFESRDESEWDMYERIGKYPGLSIKDMKDYKESHPEEFRSESEKLSIAFENILKVLKFPIKLIVKPIKWIFALEGKSQTLKEEAEIIRHIPS